MLADFRTYRDTLPKPPADKCDRVHELKSNCEVFEAIWEEVKAFDIRLNDRGYQVGDTLKLKEYDTASQSFTGRVITTKVIYMLARIDDAHSTLLELKNSLGETRLCGVEDEVFQGSFDRHLY